MHTEDVSVELIHRVTSIYPNIDIQREGRGRGGRKVDTAFYGRYNRIMGIIMR